MSASDARSVSGSGSGSSPDVPSIPQTLTPAGFVGVGVEGVAVRQIPAQGQCGWISMALVYLDKASKPPSIDAATEVLPELKHHMKQKLDHPSYKNFVSTGVDAIAQYQHKILHESYQTEHLDLNLLSAVIGVNARVVCPDGRVLDIHKEVTSAKWCVLTWKAREHYDLVYCMNSSTHKWSCILTKEQATSVLPKEALCSFMIRQHELDLVRRAEENRASEAASKAMHSSDDTPSSDRTHAAGSVTAVSDVPAGADAVVATTALACTAAAAAVVTPSQNLPSPQNVVNSFITSPTPDSDDHGLSPSPVTPFKVRQSLASSAVLEQQSTKHHVRDHSLCLYRVFSGLPSLISPRVRIVEGVSTRGCAARAGQVPGAAATGTAREVGGAAAHHLEPLRHPRNHAARRGQPSSRSRLLGISQVLLPLPEGIQEAQ